VSSSSPKLVTANGLRFAHLELGERPLVLLLHGLPDNAENYAQTMNDVPHADYRTVAPFLRAAVLRGALPVRSRADVPAGRSLCADAVVLRRQRTHGHVRGAGGEVLQAPLPPDHARRRRPLAAPRATRRLQPPGTGLDGDQFGRDRGGPASWVGGGRPMTPALATSDDLYRTGP
jgi:hypothetical protein